MLSELTGDPSYLNQVQARAGVAQYSYTVDNLRYERQTELMFEGINY